MFEKNNNIIKAYVTYTVFMLKDNYKWFLFEFFEGI